MSSTTPYLNSEDSPSANKKQMLEKDIPYSPTSPEYHPTSPYYCPPYSYYAYPTSPSNVYGDRERPVYTFVQRMKEWAEDGARSGWESSLLDDMLMQLHDELDDDDNINTLDDPNSREQDGCMHEVHGLFADPKGLENIDSIMKVYVTSQRRQELLDDRKQTLQINLSWVDRQESEVANLLSFIANRDETIPDTERSAIDAMYKLKELKEYYVDDNKEVEEQIAVGVQLQRMVDGLLVSHDDENDEDEDEDGFTSE